MSHKKNPIKLGKTLINKEEEGERQKKRREQKEWLATEDPYHEEIKHKKDNNNSSTTTIPEPMIAPHVLADEPLIDYYPVGEKQKKSVGEALTKIPKILMEDFTTLANRLASTKSKDPYVFLKGSKGGKSRKQPRKTKARRNHQKRTQRK
jgi:hypothetical protein